MVQQHNVEFKRKVALESLKKYKTLTQQLAEQYLILFVLLITFVQVGRGQNLINDNFNAATPGWAAVSISGSGTNSVSSGRMNITANAGATYGVYKNTLLSGHFYVEVDFTADDNVGLALFKPNAAGTAPDVNNYTMITVDRVNNKITVSLKDRQNGTNNVLDNTNLTDKPKRYNNTLDGNTYSLPFTSTSKKIRILRHANEKFFHFYYQVTKVVRGVSATGWQELAPSKEWSQLTGNFFMGLIAIRGSASFDNAKAWNSPTADQDDTNTGFTATTREYNWSGYSGQALVVTFDKTQAPLTGGSRKFVFWTAMNNVPAWHLDNGLLYTHEFVETWGGGNPGCHEPMSDRILRFSKVTLTENTATRKVVHWQYVLNDPNYKVPDDAMGTQLPEVNEYYYIYPDGTIIRQIQYRPKLDTQFRNWHEITELIVVAGNKSVGADHLSNPALSIWPINCAVEQYYPTGGSNYDQTKNDATILAAHFTNHPDVFSVFNDNSSQPATFGGQPIYIYKTWHDVNYEMTHWPVNKEQYYTDAFKNSFTWTEQVNHVSLAGAGVYGDTDWNSNYKVAPDGRRYREWISLMSLSPKGNLPEAKLKAQQWLANPLNWTPSASTVYITSPSNNQNFTIPANIVINATATDPSGITKVEFFSGTTKLGEDLTSPYSYTWTGATAGSYSLTAKATNANNVVTTSSPIAITVGNAIYNIVLNPGFEVDNEATQTPTSWQEWNNYESSYTENKCNARTGSYNLAHYQAGSYEVSTYQVINGIANGLYNASAWVKSSGGQDIANMSIKDYGGSELTINIPTTSTWTQISLSNINVTNGKIEIHFYSKANSGNWINVDDVSIELVPSGSSIQGSEPQSAFEFRNRNKEMDVKLFPNPTSDKFTLVVEQELINENVSIISMDGQVKKVEKLTSTTQEIDISSLPTGVYVIHFNNSKYQKMIKLVKM